MTGAGALGFDYDGPRRALMIRDSPLMVSFMKRVWLASFVMVIAMAPVAQADGPADNNADTVRPVPPPGIAVPPQHAARLQEALQKFDGQLTELREQLRGKPELLTH